MVKKSDHKRFSFHPWSWNIVTWISFVLWSYPTVAALWPPLSDPFPKVPEGSVRLPSEVMIGFPLSYLRGSIDGGNKVVWKRDHLRLGVNIAVMGWNLFCLVYASQALFSRFSLRRLMLLLLFFAILLAASHSLWSADTIRSQWSAIALIFFSPMILAALTRIYQFLIVSSNKRKRYKPVVQDPW